MVSVSQELAMFLGIVFSGMVLGLLFDIHRALTRPPRRARRRLTPARFLLDLSFWVIVTPLLFVLLVAANLAELRWYVYLGLALGFGLYVWLASPLLLRCLRWVVGRVRAGWTLLIRAFSFVFRWLKSFRTKPPGRT